MKKIIVLCLTFLLNSSFVFADNTLDTDVDVKNGENAIESMAQKLEDVKSLHENQEIPAKISSEDFEKNSIELNDVSGKVGADTSGDIENNTEIVSILSNPGSIFVTGIRSNIAASYVDIDFSRIYTHLRTSDGAVFSGRIYCYYLRQGSFGPDPYKEYYQVFYEGDIPFSYYIY